MLCLTRSLWSLHQPVGDVAARSLTRPYDLHDLEGRQKELVRERSWRRFPCRASLPNTGAHADPDSVAVKLQHSAAADGCTELPASGAGTAWKCPPPVQGEGEITDHGADVTSAACYQPVQQAAETAASLLEACSPHTHPYLTYSSFYI